MAGITAQSPAKGLGVFDPGLDPGEECAKGGVRLRGPSPWSGEGPERQPQRSSWLGQRNAKDPKGKSSVPARFASGTRKTRKANRAFRLVSPAERERPERQIERSGWLCQRNAKEKPPPRSGDKALPPCATCAVEGGTIRSRNLGPRGQTSAPPGSPAHPSLRGERPGAPLLFCGHRPCPARLDRTRPIPSEVHPAPGPPARGGFFS